MISARYRHHGGVAVAAVFAVASAFLAERTSNFPSESLLLGPFTVHRVGAFVVLFWTIVPPVAFWLDWAISSHKYKSPDPEIIMHLPDLGRNVWLALVAILTFWFGLKFPGAS